MTKSNAHILHHFYSILLEMNFHDQEIDLDILQDSSNNFINKHLRLIKLRTAKNRALLSKSTYQLLIYEIERLRKIGVDEIKKLLTPGEAVQLQPLFNKFESLSKKDQESIVEDQELLQLLSALKNKLDKSTDDK